MTNIQIPYLDAQEKVQRQITQASVYLGYLRAFDPSSWTANVEIQGSNAAYIKGVKVSKDLHGIGDSKSSSLMTQIGSRIVIASTNINDANASVIVGVY